MRNYLTELNKEQHEAVTSDSQYLRIIAGAGSGKTRVLTYRIAYLLEEKHVKPWNILAITFTNKVAAEMKERAAKLVEQNIKELTIKTFHGFCAYFLRHEINHTLGYPSSFIIYDEDDSKEKIKQACVAYGLEKKDKMVGKAMNYIYAMKADGKYPSDIVIKNNSFPEEKTFLEIYKIYETLKYDDMALDFDDLLLKTIDVLKNYGSVRLKWQGYYDHILIDEFQDTNDIQYELLKLLMKETTSLYVVGDPDQTIYTWRGANQDIILDLNKKYPSLKTIILKQNYRSTKSILDCANLLISHNKYRVKKDLVTENEKGANVSIFSGYSRSEEADWVASQIISLKAKDKDFSYNDVAILYRSSYISSSFENKFAMKRIPYVIYGGTRFYQRKEVKLALSYFRLALNLHEDFSFYKVVNEPKRKIGESTVSLIQAESKSHGLSAYSYIKNIENYPDTKLKFSTLSSLNVLFDKLEIAHQKIVLNEEAIVAVLKDLLDDIGVFEYVLSMEDGEDRLSNIKSLLDQITSFFKEDETATLETFLENVSLTSAQDEVKDIEKVRMMTVHTAKGLEFEYVFVVGVNEGVFPSNRTLLENPVYGLEEERRLCYVALTRAKKKLHVSSNSEYSFAIDAHGEKSRFFKEAGLLNRPAYNGSYEQKMNLNYYANRSGANTQTPIQNAPKIETNNKTNWHVNDRLKHIRYGIGKIIEITGDILVIDFEEHGIKKIFSYYVGLEKINTKEIEL